MTGRLPRERAPRSRAPLSAQPWGPRGGKGHPSPSGSGVAPTLLPNFAATLQPQAQAKGWVLLISPTARDPSFPYLHTPHGQTLFISQNMLAAPQAPPGALFLTVSLSLKQYLAIVPTPPYQMPTDHTVTSSSLKDPLCESLKHN